MSEEAIEYQAPQSLALMPAMTIGQAVERYQAMAQFVQELLVEDVDFGRIPGTDKPTLLKPGAEKLVAFFGLSAAFELRDQIEDWTGEDHGGEPFFYFRYSCHLRTVRRIAGEGVGSCNSWETKYRYRRARRVCPDCGEQAIIKGKEEYGGGWVCWKTKGGCGNKWPDGAPAIEGQELGQILNENPADLVNTIDKMGQKRALVAATLITVNASAFFTQDMDDMVVSGEAEPEAENGKPEAEPEKPPQKPKRKPRQKPKAEPKPSSELRPFPTYLAEIEKDPDLEAMDLSAFWDMLVEELKYDHRKHAFAAIAEDLGRDDWQKHLHRAQVMEVARRHQEEQDGAK